MNTKTSIYKDGIGSLPLPEAALRLIEILEGAGYEAWVVGGFVRDALLGHEPQDVDIATNAPWEETERICEAAGMRVRRTGIKHGTVTVLIDKDETVQAIEVTTFRVDGKHSDSRHPDQVTFVNTIEEDLARRDLTINAIAYHPQRGLNDPFGGQEDLTHNTIRMVGDPMMRFKEDALRILRVCRFCSQLGFSIDPTTLTAMLRCKHLLARISIERIAQEIEKMLLGAHVHKAIMSTIDVIGFVLPEIISMKDCAQVTKYHIYDVLEHTAYVVQNTPPYRLVRWAALCHDMGKPASAFFDEHGVEHFYGHASVSVQLAQGMLARFPLSTSFVQDVLVLVREHDRCAIEPTERSVRQVLRRLDGNLALFDALCDLKQADALSQAPLAAPRIEKLNQVRAVKEEVLAKDAAFKITDLAINGTDVITLGVAPGPEVRRILETVLDVVIDKNIPNERDVLLSLIEEHINSSH